MLLVLFGCRGETLLIAVWIIQGDSVSFDLESIFRIQTYLASFTRQCADKKCHGFDFRLHYCLGIWNKFTLIFLLYMDFI